MARRRARGRGRGGGQGKYRRRERERDRKERDRLRAKERRANARNGPVRELFMANTANRERVLQLMTSLSDEQSAFVNGNYEHFVSYRKRYMSLEQLAEMDRVINRIRMSQYRKTMSAEQRVAMNHANKERAFQSREKQRAVMNHANRERMSQFHAAIFCDQRAAVSDITCGKEKIPIPCINEVDDVAAPLDFVYVKESFESSYLCINRNMNGIKSCVCENQCRPGAPCSCFFLTTGSKCVYNKDGRLNTEISEQYNDIVIFECNQRCRCWVNQCRNRVIQKGLINPLQLFRTNGKGWGVRSPKRLLKGSFICEYIGEIISDSDADRRLNDTYLFDLTVVSINSINNDNKTIGSIDACHYGNISRFINSSCEPNCVPVKVFVDHQDLRFPRIAFFTTKDVEPYEELTFYYGDSFWDIKKEVLKCCCGAPNCISLMAHREEAEPESENSDIEIVE